MRREGRARVALNEIAELIKPRFRAERGSVATPPWSDIFTVTSCAGRGAGSRWIARSRKRGTRRRAILLDLQSRRLPKGAKLAHAAGFEPHVLVCERRAIAHEW